MESLNYHHLHYFWTVCREGSFTKAAAKLRLSQSAISEQVRRLEDVLGQQLIVRTTRKFELTETGVTVMRYADTIFAAGSELLDFLKHRPSTKRQTVRIGALGSLSRNLQVRFLSPLLDREDVELSVTVGDSKRLLRLLREHSLDVVLSTFPAGEEEAAKLYTHLLTDSPICVVGSRKIIKSRQRDLRDFLEGPRIFLPSAAHDSRSDFDHFIQSSGIKLNVGGEVDDVALLRVLALAGPVGVVIPKIGVMNELKDKSLVILHEFKNIRQRYYAITRQKKLPNPIVSMLVRPLR
ncbi:MAG: LysR family transcriptional regulator [Bdellovibrionales bacterium]|nr:LysR family transcriptional regulator [Bdellovibrionales bacterium]